MASIGDSKGIGGELKLNPPPPFSGAIEHWEEWSWQFKSYVSLFKPHVSILLESVEGTSDTITDKYLAILHSNRVIRVKD